MKHHHIFQIWVIFIIFVICSLFTLIPYDKYQKKYMDFVHDFNNVPQKHFDEQLEKANQYKDEDIIDEKELEKSQKETIKNHILSEIRKTEIYCTGIKVNLYMHLLQTLFHTMFRREYLHLCPFVKVR